MKLLWTTTRFQYEKYHVFPHLPLLRRLYFYNVYCMYKARKSMFQFTLMLVSLEGMWGMYIYHSLGWVGESVNLHYHGELLMSLEGGNRFYSHMLAPLWYKLVHCMFRRCTICVYNSMMRACTNLYEMSWSFKDWWCLGMLHLLCIHSTCHILKTSLTRSRTGVYQGARNEETNVMNRSP